MASREEKWKFEPGKKTGEKVIITKNDKGGGEVIRQKATRDIFGKSAGEITSRKKFTK